MSPISRMVSARLLGAAAAVSLLGAQSAAAQQACISEQEVVAMASFTLPSLLKGAMETCKPTLSPRGFFATQGDAMIQRYAANKSAAWPAAKSAFLKFGAEKDKGMAKTLQTMPDPALQPFVEGLVTSMVGDKIKPDQCKPLERGLAILSPLPADNTAQFVGFLVALVGSEAKPGGKSVPLVCKPAI